MIQVSLETREAFKQYGSSKSIEIEISRDGTVIETLDNSKIAYQSLELQEILETSDTLTFTGCNSNIFKFTCLDIEADIKDADIVAYITANDTDPVRLFTGKIYNAQNKTSEQRTMDIVCYDALYHVNNTDYSAWYNDLTFPISMLDFRNGFFTHIGIEQIATTLPNDSMLVYKTLEESQITGATILKNICQINGRYGKINRWGQFEYINMGDVNLYPDVILFPSPTLFMGSSASGLYPSTDLYPELDNLFPDIDENSEFIEMSGYKGDSLNIENYAVAKIDGVQLADKNNSIIGTAGESVRINIFTVSGNPFVYGDRTTEELDMIADNLYEEIKNFSYIPLTVDAVGLPYVECGDFVSILAKKTVANTFILQRTLKGAQALIDSYDSYSLEYQPNFVPNTDEKILEAVDKARKETERQLTNYDLAVQEMNSLAINAMGGYEDYDVVENDARIWYWSNYPITKDEEGYCVFNQDPPAKVFKKTGTALYVSQDGGNTWINGYDAQTGKLIINMLYAIGIEADWIVTGLLRDANYDPQNPYASNFWNLATGDFCLTLGAQLGSKNLNGMFTTEGRNYLLKTYEATKIVDGVVTDGAKKWYFSTSLATDFAGYATQNNIKFSIKIKTTDVPISSSDVLFKITISITGVHAGATTTRTISNSVKGTAVDWELLQGSFSSYKTFFSSISSWNYVELTEVYSTGTIEVKDVKFEISNEFTDWSYAPEDDADLQNIIDGKVITGITEYDLNQLTQYRVWQKLTDSSNDCIIYNNGVLGLRASAMQVGKLTDKYNYNYWDLDSGELQISSLARVMSEDADYSGNYIPTNNNSPAVNWTTEDLKQAHVGTTFMYTHPTTGAKIPYVYYKYYGYESSHPLNGSLDTRFYIFNTGITGKFKIKFNQNCNIGSNYIDIYYVTANNTCYCYNSYITGAFGNIEVVVPAEADGTFYFKFLVGADYTDWGWKIDSIEGTSDNASSYYVTTLPDPSMYDREWLNPEATASYAWRISTLEEYINLATIQSMNENLTQDTIFNLLTDNGTVQGMFMQNGQVYFNATYMKTGILDAHLIQAGYLNAKLIHGGALIIGGTDNFNGKIIVLGSNTNLQSFTSVTSATQYLGYLQTQQLDTFTISALIENISAMATDTEFTYQVYLTTDGTNFTRVDSGTFTPGASSFIHTFPTQFEITTTSGNRYYYINIYNSDNVLFDVTFSYAITNATIDENGVKAIKGSFGILNIFEDGSLNYIDDLVFRTGNVKRTLSSASTLNTTILPNFKPFQRGLVENFTLDVSIEGTYNRSALNVILEIRRGIGQTVTVVDTKTLTPSSGQIDTTVSFTNIDYTIGNISGAWYRVRLTSANESGTYNLNYSCFAQNVNTTRIDKEAFRGTFVGVIDSAVGKLGGWNYDDDEFTSDYGDDNERLYLTKTRLGLLRDGQSVELRTTNASAYMELESTSYATANFYHSNGSDIDYLINIRVSGSEADIIQGIGNVTKRNQWASSSDRRIKENIETLDIDLSKALIDATEPKKFKYIHEEGMHYGMIAQDVRETLDDLGEEDAVLEFSQGDLNVEDERAIHYEEYIPHLINYVKELRTEIDSLKTEIAELKANK